MTDKKPFARGLSWLMILLLFLGLLAPAAGLALKQGPPKVALIPLDSRPVNTDLPRQLAKVGGFELTLPPRDRLDLFLTPSDGPALMEWLQTQLKEQDLLVIHLNELLFGGLIGSRSPQAYGDSLSDKMEQLQVLLQDNRTSQVHLVYVLPRLLPSQYDKEMWAWSTQLSTYAQLRHQGSKSALEPALQAQAEDLVREIPEEILATYDSLYRAAEEVGRTLLEWSGKGLVNEVVIGLDDAAPFGPNVEIYETLQALKEESSLEQVRFLHGADELAGLILAAQLLQPQNQDTLQVHFLNPEDQDKVFPYEALPVGVHLQEKIDYLYAPRSGKESSDTTKHLIVHTHLAQDEGAAQAFLAMRKTLSPGLVGLGDVAKTNGSDPLLLQSLLPFGLYRQVEAYAGWNTAGNALGTVLAQLHFHEKGRTLKGPAQRQALEAQQQLQDLRLYDDYVFQTQVRPVFDHWSREQGLGYYSFEAQWPRANEKLQLLMEEAIAGNPHLPRVEGKGLSFSFPWPRSFELQVTSS